MQSWDITDIVQQTRGALVRGEAQRYVHGISIDSRTVQQGELFIALRGEQFDGHQFVADAVRKGAAAVIVSDLQCLPYDLLAAAISAPIVIQVADTQAALQDLALAHRRRFHGTLVAITGSNGKTTVKELTAAVLSTQFNAFKAPGNLNNHIGVPLALFRLEPTQQVAVFELGMNHLGEIRHLCELVLPHVGVITNIGLAHVGYLGSIECIQQAKGELLEALDPSGTAIVNADDPRALALGRDTAARLVTFGQGPEADVRGYIRADRGLQGLRCELHLDGSVWDVHLQLPGVHQIMNALAAAAVGVTLHIPASRIVQGLQSYRGMYGRMTVRPGQEETTLIDDTYNANPQSMQAALRFLAQLPVTGRRIAVLGDMLELGDAGLALHEELGSLVAQSQVHHLITLGPLSRHVAQGAHRAGMVAAHIHTAQNHQEALTILKAVLRPHDTVLLKGSRGMAMEHLVRALAADGGAG